MNLQSAIFVGQKVWHCSSVFMLLNLYLTIHSTYIFLNYSSQKRYLEKLKINQQVLQDPFHMLVWRCDQVALAAVWGCLHLSYIYWRLIYKGKLKAYKSLEAYNYFYSDNVHSYCILAVILDWLFWRFWYTIKAQVNPSQKSPENSHETWLLIIMRDGSVMTVQHTAHAWLGKIVNIS